MATELTRMRQVAVLLARYAAPIMPASLRHWAAAMQNELSYLSDDREALRWVLGGLACACSARLRHLHLLDVSAVRTGGVILAAVCAFHMAFATAMTLSYQLNSLRLTQAMGWLTPGGDYQRLVPLMDALPALLHLLSVGAAACYLVGACCIARRRRAGAVALLLAVTLTLATRVIERPLIEAVGVVVVAKQSLVVALVPIVLPVLLASVAWSGSRQE